MLRKASSGVAKASPADGDRVIAKATVHALCHVYYYRLPDSKDRHRYIGRLRERKGCEAVTQAQLDYYLWKLVVKRDAAGELPPFHRTRSTAY